MFSLLLFIFCIFGLAIGIILLPSRRAGISSSFCTCTLYTAHIDEQVSAFFSLFFFLVALLDTIYFRSVLGCLIKSMYIEFHFGSVGLTRAAIHGRFVDSHFLGI